MYIRISLYGILSASWRRSCIEKTKGYIEKARGYIEKPKEYIEKSRGYIEKPRGYIEKTRGYIVNRKTRKVTQKYVKNYIIISECVYIYIGKHTTIC